MKKLMTGNEAVARGAWEAGVRFAAAYPGTPSTEILENAAKYDEILAEWAPNEKAALESAIGASFAGARSMASMKHVGVNVAADPLFTFAYTGVTGGTVIISADEPGQHSAQNEQDNRNYAKAAKLPMFEPSDSRDCLEMIREAYDVSEKYDMPVFFRMTTRICHAKSIVEPGERHERDIIPYKREAEKHVCVPANAKILRRTLEDRLAKLREYSENCRFNYAEYNSAAAGAQKVGIIASGACCRYAKEVFGDSASYLKLGFTNPMPENLIKEFCSRMDQIYIIEENDPFIEEAVKLLGISCVGKEKLPKYGEMTPDVIREALLGEGLELIDYDKSGVVGRPPTLCAGCPHRGFFYELGKRKNVMISGDIGCYTLGFAAPYNAMDSCICMGGSFSIGHGAQQIFNMRTDEKWRVVSVLGDSTFFHTGINSLIDVVYNNSNTVNVILDNRITGMTGHQENPGTGFNAKGDPANAIDIEAMVRAIGIKHVKVVDPNDLKEVSDALDEFLALDEPSVIITRWPCALKRFSEADKKEFSGAFTQRFTIDASKCIGCRLCMKCGCPAISFDSENKKAVIERIQCLGCEVCAQLCPKSAIVKEAE